jgi:hypothetical protein
LESSVYWADCQAICSSSFQNRILNRSGAAIDSVSNFPRDPIQRHRDEHMREASRAAGTPGEPVAMITYASFCSISLFKQTPKHNRPLTGARTEMATQARLYSDDSERHLVTNNVRAYCRKAMACRSYCSARPRISPRERRPYLRFATGGEEQEISEHKTVKKGD